MKAGTNAVHREPWNKGKIFGQKAPFKVQDIWALRVRLWKYVAREPIARAVTLVAVIDVPHVVKVVRSLAT